MRGEGMRWAKTVSEQALGTSPIGTNENSLALVITHILDGRFSILKGLEHSAQGCEAASYPG